MSSLLVFALLLFAPPRNVETLAPDVLGTIPHRYEWVPGWIKPPGPELGNTHGVIVEDSEGNLYINTDTEHAISVYTHDGSFVRSFAADQGEGVHGMCIVREAAGEFLYHVNHRLGVWRKLALDGRVVMTNGCPMESGKYTKPEEFHPTSIAVGPDGSIYVADGYGTSWVHKFDAGGKYKSSFGGKPDMDCPHGLLIDTRTDPPRLLVADREHHRILVLDLDGKKIDVIEGMLRRPCSMQEHDGYLAVADLAGRVTILDRDNKLVCQLGDQPDEALRAQNGVPREKWKDGVFIAPHSAHWDKEGNLYVMDWNFLGRVNKLRRLLPPILQGGVGYKDTPFLPGSEWRVHDRDRPPAPVVKPQPFVDAKPPAGAIVLFDGKDLSHWKGGDKDAQWNVRDGYAEVNGTGSIETKEKFGDMQLHVEFATPAKVKGDSQGRGNSGVFLMSRYEVQVLDSFENPTYADGQCAALYGQTPPKANASRGPGEWQTYDITFTAPRFKDGKVVSPAIVTVVHNGVLVQDKVAFLGGTRHRALATYDAHEAELPLSLQDHGDPVRYRNIWVKRL